MPGKRYPDETRERALELARESGTSAASRELGIPEATIRYWRRKAGELGPPSGADPDDWAAKKAKGAEEAWDAAQEAMERVRKLLRDDDSNPREAQQAALAFAILVDKSGLLQKQHAEHAERAAKLAEAQAEAIAEALLSIFAALDLPRDERMRDLFLHYLRPLEDSAAPRGEAPNADEARAAVREKFREEWDNEVQRIQPIAELPPPSADREDEEEVTGEV